MINLIAVFIGGGIGSILRYIAGICLPFPTLIVNVLGSFLLGFLFAFLMQKPEISQSLKLALTVGFCGGLTTFSTFSFQIFEMIELGHWINGLLYAIVSLFLGVVSVFVGVYFAKFV